MFVNFSLDHVSWRTMCTKQKRLRTSNTRRIEAGNRPSPLTSYRTYAGYCNLPPPIEKKTNIESSAQEKTITNTNVAPCMGARDEICSNFSRFRLEFDT